MTTNRWMGRTSPIKPQNLTTKIYGHGAGMDAEHEAHLQRILRQFTADARAKYENGQREHGGNLWEKPGMLEHALEEAIDQVIYLYTALEQRDRRVAFTGRDS